MRMVSLNHIKGPFIYCAHSSFHVHLMSHRPTKRAKKAPETIQRGAHIETSTSRGSRTRNVGIAPAPSVGTSRENTRDREHPQVPSFNAPDHMDFFVLTEEEVRAAHGKVGRFLSSILVVYHSGLDTK